MTPLEVLEAAAHWRGALNARLLTPRDAYEALVASGDLPAPDVTIKPLTFTAEEADAVIEWWDCQPPLSALNRVVVKVRDAILEARQP